MRRAWVQHAGLTVTLWLIYAAWARFALGGWVLGFFRSESVLLDLLALGVILTVVFITARRVASARGPDSN